MDIQKFQLQVFLVQKDWCNFRVNLKFTPLNEFLKTGQVVDPNKLVQVIDCIGNTRPNIGYVNGAHIQVLSIFIRADGTTVRMVGVNHTSEFHETIYDTLEESLGQVNQRIVQPQQSTTTTTTTTTTTPTSTSSNTTTTTTTTTSPSTSSCLVVDLVVHLDLVVIWI